MKHPRTTLLILVGSTLFAAGCRPSSTPCPTDASLIERFVTHEARFGTLVSTPEDSAIHAILGIDRVVQRSENPIRLWFPVWIHDFAGPGGSFKGYAYCETTPSLQVASIDTQSNPGSPEIKEIYRHIQGNWYLFYHSDN